MNKKLMIVIIILLVCIVTLSVYKFGFHNKDIKKYYFSSTELRNHKEDLNDTNVLDSDTYKDSIITEKIISVDYNFLHDSKSITGTVYIGTDKYLYINDINSSYTYRVSTIKFKTLYAKNFSYSDGIYVYLLSNENKLYLMCLEENDITKTKLIDLSDINEYVNFVEINFDEDKFSSSNTVFLLDKNGYIYEVYSGLRYSDDIKSLYNKMYILGNKTIINVNGLIAQDKSGNCYKIKYIFDTYENNKFIPDNKIIIVTEDNRFIYFDDSMENVYEFNKKVKDVNFDVYYPYVEGNLKVTFEDDYNVDLKASCNQYYCVNEFAE